MATKKLKHIADASGIVSEIKIKKSLSGFIPPLNDYEYCELKENIKEFGIREPLLVWDKGKEKILLDGHNRLQVWNELKKEAEKENEPFDIELPIDITSDFGTEDDAKIWMMFNQFGRRNLSAYTRVDLALQLEEIFREIAKKRQSSKYRDRIPELAASWMEYLPSSNLENISEGEKQDAVKTQKFIVTKALSAITGVPERTLQRVKRVREFMEEFEYFEEDFDAFIESDEGAKETFAGADEKPSDWLKEEWKEIAVIPQRLRTGEMSISAAEKKILIFDRKRKAEQKLHEYYLSNIDDFDNSPYRCLNMSFQDAKAKIKEGTVSAVITDIPYRHDWAKNYFDLFAFCEHALHPGGRMLVMCGTLNLPALFLALSKYPSLKYAMTLAWLHGEEDSSGGGNEMEITNFRSMWKPIILCSKEEQFTSTSKQITNTIRAGKVPPEKKSNENVQDILTFEKLIDRFTLSGEVVCDPCMGEGTTGIAAIHLGRFFIGIEDDKDSFILGQSRIREEWEMLQELKKNT